MFRSITRNSRWMIVMLLSAISFSGMIGCVSHDDDRARDNDRGRSEDHRGDYHADHDDHYDHR